MSGQQNEETLVRVVELFNVIDANLVKGALESSDIFSTIEGENISNLSITVDGVGNQIYVQVLEKDLPKSIEIIKNLSVPVRMLRENV